MRSGQVYDVNEQRRALRRKGFGLSTDELVEIFGRRVEDIIRAGRLLRRSENQRWIDGRDL